MSYFDIYQKRLNRYGETVQERMKNKRAIGFEKYKAQSVYKIPFKEGEAVFEPDKISKNQYLGFLLTDLNELLHSGEVYELTGAPWMVLYLDENHARGYNKWVMVKLTHTVSFNGGENTPAYYCGPLNGTIKDALKNQADGALYEENDKVSHLIMPNRAVSKDDYVIINQEPDEAHLVTGFDKTSIPGVIYITLNDTILRDSKKIDIDESSRIWA